MKKDKVEEFMRLGGQEIAKSLETGELDKRRLGAQLLLSEVLEYVIKGLGVIPSFNGTKITDANELEYHDGGKNPDKIEMIDGLADVAYTMYWNAIAFGIPLDKAYDIVCDNNLEKFVALENWQESERPLERNEWDCGLDIEWPEEVVEVSVLKVNSKFFAVGKDKNGKVRKPSSYDSVDLTILID